MIKIIDFNNCPLSVKNGFYGGQAGSKDGIIYQNEIWMIKYPKNIVQMTGADVSYSTAPLSEYLGSHIYQLLGYAVHETLLGERNNKLVVACRDFTDNDKILLEIRTIKNHHNEHMSELFEHDFLGSEENHITDLEELFLHLEYNPILSHIPNIKAHFFEQALIDIFINNNDRNSGNWGILRDKQGCDIIAPVFDNGACFQTKMSEDKIQKFLADEEQLRNSALQIRTAYGLQGKQYFASTFLKWASAKPEYHQTVQRVVPLLCQKMPDIMSFLLDIPEKHMLSNGKNIDVCSFDRKRLYAMQMLIRYNEILYPAYIASLETQQLLTHVDSSPAQQEVTLLDSYDIDILNDR